LVALVLVFAALFLLLSLTTFDPADPSFNHVVSGPEEVENGAGLAGAYAGGLLADFIGLGGYVVVAAFLLGGLSLFLEALTMPWWRWLGLAMLGLCLTGWASTDWVSENVVVGDVAGGGFLGALLYEAAKYVLRPVGTFLVWIFVLIAAIQLLSGASWGALGKRLRSNAVDLLAKYQERMARRRSRPAAAEGEKRPEKQPEKLKDPEPKKEKEKKEKKDLLRWPKLFGGTKPDEDEEESREESPKDMQDDSRKNFQTTTLVGAEQREKEKPAAAIDSPQAPIVLPGLTSPDPAQPDSPHPGTAQPDTAQTVTPGAPGTSVPAIPSLSLLKTAEEVPNGTTEEDLEARGETLAACLAEFNIQGEVRRIVPGPVVTMFEYKPGPGVKVSRIENLSDDLALAMKALAVRIQAPIPGKDSVGVEIPNENRQTVFLQDILESEAFQKSESLLTLALGKDISGAPRVADLARMPHLLVAGATGAGKSVCINSILLSFLYKARPEELKLLLVDPKRIELSVYADLPHLVHPVVTDMSDAKSAMDWAVYEMERRYEAMARLGVRNIEGYNVKLAELGKDRDPELADLEPMPFLVLVIDELADLMLTAAKEVETSIVRLAQLARASGIHMILATQRPSVDVVTGLIKANFPSRISFQVTSRHDSRTILDTVGAEHLLGKGDMLFKAGGGRLERMHGAFVADEEVAGVVEFWKKQQSPTYELDFSKWRNEENTALGGGVESGDMSDDPMYAEALEFVSSQGRASISLLQRRFRIGFNRAARYVEQMEADGVIGPADGSKPRIVNSDRGVS
jgi:DNA segregation ATPase FtsK/SpoIIIE, S-DNA-T family